MAQYSAFFNNNVTARILRAVYILSLAGLLGSAWAVDNNAAVQSPAQSSQPPASNTHKGIKTTQSTKSAKASNKSSKPQWSDLTAAQQQALSPLASDWGRIDTLRKQKWLVIANKFSSMKPEEQQRVQDRMREWAKLTPAQRRAAREAYARAKKLNADQKSAKWQQYQSLPEEEKRKLAAEAEAKHKKHLANLPRSGINKNKTATSVKSVAKVPLAQPGTEHPAVPPAQATPAAAPQSTPPSAQTPTK